MVFPIHAKGCALSQYSYVLCWYKTFLNMVVPPLVTKDFFFPLYLFSVSMSAWVLVYLTALNRTLSTNRRQPAWTSLILILFFPSSWPEQHRILDYRPLSVSESKGTTWCQRRRKKKSSSFSETSPTILSIQVTETFWIMSGFLQVTRHTTANIQICLQLLMLLVQLLWNSSFHEGPHVDQENVCM